MRKWQMADGRYIHLCDMSLQHLFNAAYYVEHEGSSWERRFRIEIARRGLKATYAEFKRLVDEGEELDLNELRAGYKAVEARFTREGGIA